MPLDHTCNDYPWIHCDGCLAVMDQRMQEEPRDLLAEAFLIVESQGDISFSLEHLVALVEYIRQMEAQQKRRMDLRSAR